MTSDVFKALDSIEDERRFDCEMIVSKIAFLTKRLRRKKHAKLMIRTADANHILSLRKRLQIFIGKLK